MGRKFDLRMAHGGACSPLPSRGRELRECFEDAMSVDHEHFVQGPELASQRIRQLEEKNKEARRLQTLAKKETKKFEKAYKAGTCPRGLHGFDMIRPSCLAGPSKGKEEVQLEEEESLRLVAPRGKDHREGRITK